MNNCDFPEIGFSKYAKPNRSKLENREYIEGRMISRQMGRVFEDIGKKNNKTQENCLKALQKAKWVEELIADWSLKNDPTDQEQLQIFLQLQGKHIVSWTKEELQTNSQQEVKSQEESLALSHSFKKIKKSKENVIKDSKKNDEKLADKAIQANDYTVENQEDALYIAQSIDCKGKLVQAKCGYLYLKVPNELITEVVPKLVMPGKMIPTRTHKKSKGAHISVMVENERCKLPEDILTKLGDKEFSFKVSEIRSFTAKGARFWALIVSSPEIEELRQQYGLPGKLKGHDFHISLGKQRIVGEPSLDIESENAVDWTALDESNAEDSDNEIDYSVKDFTKVDQERALEVAKAISNFGTLQKKENGFVYLKVDNDFCTQLGEALETTGIIQTPPCSKRSLGAHITVFGQSELAGKQIWNIPEIGQKFKFEVKEIREVKCRTQKGVKDLFLVAVRSKGLETLRESYDLDKKFKGHDFHITIGKQMPVVPKKISTPLSSSMMSQFDVANIRAEDHKASGDFKHLEVPGLQEAIKNIECVGRLEMKKNGFVHLNVSNDFIDAITPLFKDQIKGVFTPKSTNSKKINSKKEKTGAHISVIHEDEIISNRIWKISEINKGITFLPLGLTTGVGSGKDKWWTLRVASPGLENLRKDLGLSPRLQGHEFHISLGKELYYG